MKLHNNKKKRLYVGLIKASKDLKIAPTRIAIARHVGISAGTFRKYLKNTSIYDTNDFCIWTDVSIDKLKRGFAFK